jgi:outer membrane protein OmpA-like peptidoglycan-associated protein
MFDLGSSALHASEKPKIAAAVSTAKARQVSVVCVVGNTDKLGDKAMNAKLAAARSQAVAAEMVRAGLPAKSVVIAANPEAFGNESLGGADAQVNDRRVTIVFTR